MIRTPQRTWQTGTYRTGSPDYVEVGSGTVSEGMQSFISSAGVDNDNGDSWATGDIIGILIYKDALNWKIWTSTWNSASYYLVLETEEESVGTILTGDEVQVSAVPTKRSLALLTETPKSVNYVTEASSAMTLTKEHSGKVIRFTSSSPVAVSVPDGLPAGMQCVLAQCGAGNVTVSMADAGTLNGLIAPIALAGQWKTGYLYHTTSDAWELFA